MPTTLAFTHVQPPDWWDVFWKRNFDNTGQSREEAMKMLHKLLGDRRAASSLEQAEKAFERMQGGVQ